MLVSANPGCDYVQDLERRNLMVYFIRAMKEAGLGDRTQSNLFGAIVTFLHAQGHPVVTRKDAPDYTETEIETYSREDLGQLFGACTAAERLEMGVYRVNLQVSSGSVMVRKEKRRRLTLGTIFLRFDTFIQTAFGLVERLKKGLFRSRRDIAAHQDSELVDLLPLAIQRKQRPNFEIPSRAINCLRNLAPIAKVAYDLPVDVAVINDE